MQCCSHVCYGILSILFLVIRPTWESLKILYTVNTFDHGTHCTYRSIGSETAAILLGLQVASCHENSYHPIELVCNKSGPHNGLLNNPTALRFLRNQHYSTPFFGNLTWVFYRFSHMWAKRKGKGSEMQIHSTCPTFELCISYIPFGSVW